MVGADEQQEMDDDHEEGGEDDDEEEGEAAEETMANVTVSTSKASRSGAANMSKVISNCLMIGRFKLTL